MVALNKRNILIIGRHAELLDVVLNQVTQQGYHAIGTLTNEEALIAFKSSLFDAVILGGGVDLMSRQTLKQEFLSIHPGIRILEVHPQNILVALNEAFQN
jgi:DNA-binding response OmpR family regulator